MNSVSQLSHRGDLILTSPGFSTTGAVLIGVDTADRTVSGLWPSDHAGVVATLDVAVPEPASLAVLVTGVFALGLVRIRRGWTK